MKHKYLLTSLNTYNSNIETNKDIEIDLTFFLESLFNNTIDREFYELFKDYTYKFHIEKTFLEIELIPLKKETPIELNAFFFETLLKIGFFYLKTIQRENKYITIITYDLNNINNIDLKKRF